MRRDWLIRPSENLADKTTGYLEAPRLGSTGSPELILWVISAIVFEMARKRSEVAGWDAEWLVPILPGCSAAICRQKLAEPSSGRPAAFI